MTYEYDLRRLFCLRVDYMPLSEQLQRYRQRDLAPSHLYRLGAGLFGDGRVARRRVIDSKHFSPPEAAAKKPHAALLSRSLDGRERSYGQLATPPNLQSTHARAPSLDLTLTTGDAGGFSEAEYRQWLANRRSMRTNLEGLGANQQWLCSKERTQLENTLLVQLRNRQKPVVSACTSEDSIEVESVSSRASSPTFEETRKGVLRHRKQVLKEVAMLEKYLTKYRQRFVSLLMSIDRSHDYCIFSSDLVIVLHKMKAPISEACISTFLEALPRVKTSRIDYRILLNGLLVEMMRNYFKAQDEKEHTMFAGGHDDTVDESKSASEVLSLEKHTAGSTLKGPNGEMAEEYKQEELRQFQKLIAYCNENGIMLDWKLAETALLLPPDHSKEACAAGLRQPGLALLSSHFADPKEKEAVQRERRLSEDFGNDYKELRGRRKGKFVRLATGSTTVKPKIDCWLTYAEYKKLTEHIRSRPGFKYHRHELPDNNAFWPGALLDKLRLWMPKETLLDKPYSLYNMFQPVQHPKIYNPYSPMVTQRKSWPENSRGYVQFGGQNRKQYHV